ncbi:unknown [Clostridium sp. CAG:433]|nr:unknown [Clostridium sp. CAG:433]
MRKCKVEDLYITIISDGYYAKDCKILSTINPDFAIVKYSGWKKCLVFDTKERLKVYSKYYMCDIKDNERVANELIPLYNLLKDKSIKSLTLYDILYLEKQLKNKYDENNSGLLELPKKDNDIVSNEFLLEIKKVMDKIDPNMNEELKEKYKIKLSNIGNEYINSVIENYNSIKLNPSIELEILKKYLVKLCVLEEEIVKLNYRSNLESELEQVKRYTNNN